MHLLFSAHHQYFPIFDQLEHLRAPSSVTDDAEYDPSKHNVVGSITATLFWRNLIMDILPLGSDGVVVVFENPCNPTFTYQINGPSVEYLGRGDMHDLAYEDHGITSNFFNLRSFAVGSSMYSGPPLDSEFCPFQLRVYPSDDMYNNYATNDPIIFTVAAVMIFVFTSLIFCLYDCTVQRRQRLVLNMAEKSTAIVSSLFPEQVREQLAEAVVSKMKKHQKAGLTANQQSQRRMQTFLEEGDLADKEGFDENTAANSSSPSALPIASLYPETTVMFADIAGMSQSPLAFHICQSQTNI